jgi:AraC-like DNA-binding protein
LEKCDAMPGAPITPRSVAAATGLVRVTPAADLLDIVEQHWVLRWDRRGRPAQRHEVLGDPSVNLAVEPTGRLLYGPGSGRSTHELTGRGMVVATKFRPGGFSGLWPGPVGELTGRVLPIADAFGSAGAHLDAALRDAGSINAIVDALTAFVRAHRPAGDAKRTLAIEIVEAMRAAPPGTGVADIAARFAISPRTLQRLFAHHVGISPKQVLQRFRRQLAADRLAEPVAPNLGRLAADLGYFDQAHLARDFRQTLGRNPSSLRRVSGDE